MTLIAILLDWYLSHNILILMLLKLLDLTIIDLMKWVTEWLNWLTIEGGGWGMRWSEADEGAPGGGSHSPGNEFPSTVDSPWLTQTADVAQARRSIQQSQRRPQTSITLQLFCVLPAVYSTIYMAPVRIRVHWLKQDWWCIIICVCNLYRAFRCLQLFYAIWWTN